MIIRANETNAGMIYCAIFIVSLYILVTALTAVPVSVIGLISGSLGLLVSLFGMFTIFNSRFTYIPDKSKVQREPQITITEKEIICNYSSQNVKDRVQWDKINRIQILTTDEGPESCDVFYMIRDSTGGGVSIPHDREESKIVTDRILSLPGFDFEMFTKAMGSTENKWFDVWEKK